MKKLFFLAATMCAAMAMNAASFTGFDARTVALGEQIASGLIQDKVNVDVTEASTGKYEISLIEGGVEGSFSMGGVVFKYTNSTAGAVAYKTYGTYIQPNGKQRDIVIPTTAGEKVDVFVVDNCPAVLVEGADGMTSVDLVAYGEGKDVANTFTATGSQIVLSTDANKPKLAAILPHGGTTNLEGVSADDVKSNRMFVNGVMYVWDGAKQAWVNVLGF